MFVSSMLISLLGGILILDRTPALQIMVSRPLVASTLLGFLLGDVSGGLTIGFLLELLWLGQPPVGASLTPNETAIAVVVTAVTLMAGEFIGDVSRDLMVFVILLFLPVGWIFQKIDEGIRHINSKISRDASFAIRERGGDGMVLNKAVLKGLTVFFIPNFLLLWFFIASGSLVVASLFPLLSQDVRGFLGNILYLFPVVGIASVMTSFKTLKRPFVWFAMAYSLMVIVSIGKFKA